MSAQISDRDQDLLQLLEEMSDEGLFTSPMDFEAMREDADSMADTLEDWFGYEDWNSTGDTFLQIGVDGAGSMFCLWFYPELAGDPPVVFIGSEGERGLVAEDLREFLVRLVAERVYDGEGWASPDGEEVKVNWSALQGRVGVLLGEADFESAYEPKPSIHPSFVSWLEEREE